MERNKALYSAAWKLVYAAREINKYEPEISKELLKKADQLSKKIEIDSYEMKEIKKYEFELTK